ncbi:MAG: cytidine deaminase [Lachnospiraceae bacterium]|nr:cytidine deaminase [Lachnospiraceae bacterium]
MKEKEEAQKEVQKPEGFKEKPEDFKKQLVRQALLARENAYAAYSGYSVGAALMTAAGKIYAGCNVENASFGATNCAERTAFFKAVSEGERSFAAIAIAGGKTAPSDYAYPCGVCRQVMQEFCDEKFLILVAKSEEDYREYTLKELLPYGFGGDRLI